MAPDAAKVEDTRAWLRKAALDLLAADHEAARPGGGLWSDITFHAQQAVEKTFKAFLAWHDAPFRKTHSLEELGRACTELDASLAGLVNEAAPLTEYAWKYRYPGEGGEATQAEAEAALAVAALTRPCCSACRKRCDRERDAPGEVARRLQRRFGQAGELAASQGGPLRRGT